MAEVKRTHDAYEMIYSVVASIPRGRVATYGQVAYLAGLPGRARQVGYALRVLPDDHLVPWHRVVNAGGGISRRRGGEDGRYQRRLLESEGIVFDGRNRLSLPSYQWDP